MREYKYDVLVVGSGISGSSIAYELRKYDIHAAVLEKGSDLCAAATRGNSATVHAGFDAAYGTLKARYNVSGNSIYPSLCAELGVPFVQNGTILIATSQSEWETVFALLENARKNGVPGVRCMDRQALLEREGYFGPAVMGGLYAPTGGMVCPYTLAIALCENAAVNGVDFFLNTTVTDVKKRQNDFIVNTSAGVFQTKVIFNCAGTHADELNNAVSVNQLHIIPRKGVHIILDKRLAPYVRATVCQTPVPLASGGHTKGMGIMPTVDGTILLGCDAKDAEDKEDASTTKEGISDILGYFERIWPHLPVCAVYPRLPYELIIGAFGGLRPHLDTDDFVLGEPEDCPGFFNMAGIESPGLTAAPAIAIELVTSAARKYQFVKKSGELKRVKRTKPFRLMNLEERKRAVEQNSDYGKVICRCESITRAEILAAIRAPIGARTIDAVKMRTRAGMGRCQGGFCETEVAAILAEELGVNLNQVTKRGGCSNIIMGDIADE